MRCLKFSIWLFVGGWKFYLWVKHEWQVTLLTLLHVRILPNMACDRCVHVDPALSRWCIRVRLCVCAHTLKTRRKKWSARTTCCRLRWQKNLARRWKSCLNFQPFATLSWIGSPFVHKKKPILDVTYFNTTDLDISLSRLFYETPLPRFIVFIVVEYVISVDANVAVASPAAFVCLSLSRVSICHRVDEKREGK